MKTPFLQDQNSDIFLYLLFAALALIVFGFLKKSRSLTFKGTKWANKNRIKAKWLIVFCQLGLVILGLAIGKNLGDLNYTFSNSIQYVFMGMMTIAFFGLWINDKQEKVRFLRVFYLRKVGHLVLGLSFLGLTIGIGNNFSEHRNSFSSSTQLEEKIYTPSGDSVDMTLSVYTEPNEASVAGFVILYIVLALALICGLLILACASYCWGGPAFGTFASAIFIGIIFLVIRAMVRHVQRLQKGELKNNQDEVLE